MSLAFSATCKVTTSKFTAKLLFFCHSENYIKLTFVVVSHSLVRLFRAPLPAAPGGYWPRLALPLSYATAVLDTYVSIRYIIKVNDWQGGNDGKKADTSWLLHSIIIFYNLVIWEHWQEIDVAKYHAKLASRMRIEMISLLDLSSISPSLLLACISHLLPESKIQLYAEVI